MQSDKLRGSFKRMSQFNAWLKVKFKNSDIKTPCARCRVSTMNKPLKAP